jgi:curli biogenesis system outer membrane secretion channel CsgG
MRTILTIGAMAAMAVIWLSTEASIGAEGNPPKPKLAVLEFSSKTDNQWWHHGGAASAQDEFVNDIRRSGKFDVLSRETLESLMMERDLSISGDIDPKTAVKIGKILGVNYVLIGAVTEFGISGKSTRSSLSAGTRKFAAALSARLVDVSTGKIVWTDKARNEVESKKVSVFGVGSGAEDSKMFDMAMKPCIRQMTAGLESARF